MSTDSEPGIMTLHRLKWLAVLAPLLFLAALELIRHFLLPDLFHAWPGYLLLAGVILLGTLFFAETIFGIVNRLQDRLGWQNRELLALHEAGLGILAERELEPLLQLVVDGARELVGARYGALSIVHSGGGIDAFLVSGITPEQRALLGDPPSGHGLLAVVLTEGQPLRLADLTQDPRSVGFPPHHPPMRSLLAVPVVAHGNVLGNLYLAEKLGQSEFDVDDEETLGRFATVAALAIENARLHRRVRALAVTEERERIAREMHDSLAQVLAYVNTKAQATASLLERGQTERATAQLSQLAEAARASYADVREGILGLRTSLGEGRSFVATLELYLEQWQAQSGVAARLETVPADAFSPLLSPNAEVQLLRIIQEALSNVRKHAEASRALVHLEIEDRLLKATVEDDGVGFDPESLGRATLPRFGLATMRERAEAVGGGLSITPVAPRGTRVAVSIPIETSFAQSREAVGARLDR
jgi:signal transduction histidine kinase